MELTVSLLFHKTCTIAHWDLSITPAGYIAQQRVEVLNGYLPTAFRALRSLLLLMAIEQLVKILNLLLFPQSIVSGCCAISAAASGLFPLRAVWIRPTPHSLPHLFFSLHRWHGELLYRVLSPPTLRYPHDAHIFIIYRICLRGIPPKRPQIAPTCSAWNKFVSLKSERQVHFHRTTILVRST